MAIKRTIAGAPGYLYEFRAPFGKALFIPIIILVALENIPIQKYGPRLLIPLNILALYVYTVLAIITHRIILLGPESVFDWGE